MSAQGHDVEATPLMPAIGDATATQVIARQPTEVMPPPEPEGSSKRMWLGVLIGILIVAILAGGGYLLAQSLGNKDAATKPMPDVVGQQFDAAKATLENQYQLVVTKDTQPTDAKPAGTVLRQSITVGDPVAAGTSVTLTVAEKLPLILVPSLHCNTLEQAQTALPNGLTIGGRRRQPRPTPRASRARSSLRTPPPGDQVKPGTLVNVTLNPSTPDHRHARRLHVRQLQQGQEPAQEARPGRRLPGARPPPSRSARTRTSSRCRIRRPGPWSRSGVP